MRTSLDQILEAALGAIEPGRCLHQLLTLDQSELTTPSATFDLRDFRKVWLLAVGKASIPMAMALEEILASYLEEGQAVAPRSDQGLLFKTKVWQASHPEPDQAGLEAAAGILEWLQQELEERDLLVLALSGGGSALFPAPLPGISLEDKQKVTHELLRSGATIHEMNALRKHLSRVKGGRLLDFTRGARVLVLALSDVAGDDFSSIASGPASPDPTTRQDCLEILERYHLRSSLPPSVTNSLNLEQGSETPKPGDPRFSRVSHCLVANNHTALAGAAEKAARLGYTPLILSSSLSGECHSTAANLAAIAREVVHYSSPVAPPCCLLSGGECTLRVRGEGKGGRNQEMALEFSRHIEDWNAPLLFASVGSDGIDGPTDAAGAVVDPKTLRRAAALGLDPRAYLARNDSYHFFQRLEDLILTGPTQTNVMDLQILLIGTE